MQTLFAFEQCKEANNQLAQDLIQERFSPDLNSMEVQDKALLKAKGKEAMAIYIQKFAGEEVAENADARVEKAVSEALRFYADQSKKDFSFLKKNMLAEIAKINHLYYAVLGLLLEFAAIAKEDRKSNHLPFINNAWIRSLQAQEELKSFLIRDAVSWKNERVRVVGWFRDIIKTDAQYLAYNQLPAPDLENQKAIIKHIVRNLILNGTINDYLAEVDIRWAEDHHIVKSLVDKTIKSFREDTGTIQIHKLSMDWEDDLIFIDTLFEKTANLEADKKDLIARNTKNWEVDRLPLTDRVILEMAIAEMIHFPGIPVKVSINEYIELAKAYSTPKSPQFVNGILDVMSRELQSQGTVKKSGKGLIDNK